MAPVIYRLSPSLAPRPMQSDATFVAGRSADAAERQRRMDEEARQAPSNLLQRKMRIKRANAARAKPLSETTLESFADATSAIGDKFRLFPDQVDNVYSWVDETFNPLYFLGEVGSGLGQVPLAAKEGRTEDVVMGIGAPIAARIGGELFGPLFGSAAKSTGRYLTTETPLANAYKMNPFAYMGSPEMMYRGVGIEGMTDAVGTGYFRARPNVAVEYFPGTKLPMQKDFTGATYWTPDVNVARTYADVIAEVPKSSAQFRNRYKNKTWSQLTNDVIPVEQAVFYRPHWLKGLEIISP